MEIRYRQHQPWGCGMYAIAHALNLESFISTQRLEDSKGFGNTDMQLNRWLSADGHDYNIVHLFFNVMGSKLPESFAEFTFSGPDEITAMPLLVHVQRSENSLCHCVGAHLTKKGDLFLHDSLNEEVTFTSLRELNDCYHSVHGLSAFMNEKGEYVFIHAHA